MNSFDITSDNRIFVLNANGFLRFASNSTGSFYQNPVLIDLA